MDRQQNHVLVWEAVPLEKQAGSPASPLAAAFSSLPSVHLTQGQALQTFRFSRHTLRPGKGPQCTRWAWSPGAPALSRLL